MGLALILLTGLVWGGIGVILGVAARRKLDVLAFMTAAGLLSAIAGWVMLPHWPSLLAGNMPRALPLVLLMSVAGVAGTLGMLFLQKAMSAGAAAWTVGQSAMVVPFLVGILFLGEPLRMGGACGLVAILASLVAFAMAPTPGAAEKTTAGRGWFCWAFIALVLLGVQQTLSSIPSAWEDWTDTARLRVPLILGTGVLPLLVVSAWRRQWPTQAAWRLAAGYAVLVIAGQFLLFTAMDQLRTEGRLALAFPLALGCCMVVVALCDIVVWKNRPSRFTLAGIALGLVGVLALTI